MDDFAESGALYIGEGVIANGAALVPGKATLNGQFEGALTAKHLEILSKGVVSGTIQASLISVAGNLSKAVEATEVLSIESSGVVSGNITYGKLEVAKGGEILGTMNQR